MCELDHKAVGPPGERTSPSEQPGQAQAVGSRVAGPAHEHPVHGDPPGRSGRLDESPAGRRGSRGWPPAGQEGHPAVAQVGQVGARLVDGPGRRGGQARGLGLERLGVGDGQPRLGQAPDVVRVGRPAGHHERVDPLGAQAVELAAFHRRRALGVGHDHRVPVALGPVLDGPQEGQEHRIGQVGHQHPDDHRPLGAQAAGRRARGVAQGLGGGPDPAGGLRTGRAPSGQHPGHGGRADPGLGRHLTDVRPHRDDRGGGSVDAATAPPYCKRLHNQRGRGDGRRAREPEQQASDLVGRSGAGGGPGLFGVRRIDVEPDHHLHPSRRRPPPADRGAPRRPRPARWPRPRAAAVPC